MSYRLSQRSLLGVEPDTVNHLNGGSAQQDSLVTYQGYQYCGFWRDAIHKAGVRHMVIARRLVNKAIWEDIEFLDYEQTVDDGHNTICIGICEADGTIHAAFDMHDTPLNYRVSSTNLVTDPSLEWSAASFGPIEHALPVDTAGSCFQEVTYPRFVSLPEPRGALAFEYRTGISGLGDCWLFVYSGFGRWVKRGMYLKGIQNNPYLNGIDPDSEGYLHVSWCYRDYVPATLAESRAQAGPNGPENNHDVLYAYSPPAADGLGPGLHWFASDGTLAGESGESPIRPGAKGVCVFDVPKFSGGSLNQEAQCVDGDRGVHVLNRERQDGKHHWYHYYHELKTKQWLRRRIPIQLPGYLSSRGKLLSLPKSHSIAIILPLVPDLVIFVSTRDTNYSDWREVGRVANGGAIEAAHVKVAHNVTGGLEPAIDRSRAMLDDCISIFVGVTEVGIPRKSIQVLDFVSSSL